MNMLQEILELTSRAQARFLIGGGGGLDNESLITLPTGGGGG